MEIDLPSSTVDLAVLGAAVGTGGLALQKSEDPSMLHLVVVVHNVKPLLLSATNVVQNVKQLLVVDSDLSQRLVDDHEAGLACEWLVDGAGSALGFICVVSHHVNTTLLSIIKSIMKSIIIYKSS